MVINKKYNIIKIYKTKKYTKNYTKYIKFYDILHIII